MNAIEAPLASERVFGDQYMSHCDQVCMAVAIDDKCCLKSTKRKVNLSYFNPEKFEHEKKQLLLSILVIFYYFRIFC